MPEFLLISDLDDTLLGDDAATRRFADFAERNRDDWWIVYNSSRFADSIERSIRDTPLPEPDLLIGGMGTQVRAKRCRERGMDLDRALDQWVGGLAREHFGDRARDIVHRIGRVEPQPAHNQSDLKASFHLHDATPDELDEIDVALRAAGFDASLTYSSHRDLDVLPAGVSKAAASGFVAELLGVDADHTIVAGDSGNDTPMLTAGFLAVVVANARPELAHLAGPRIYRARHPRADGVIEGMTHWARRGSLAS